MLLYMLLIAIIVVYQCLLFLLATNDEIVHNCGKFSIFCSQSRFFSWPGKTKERANAHATRRRTKKTENIQTSCFSVFSPLSSTPTYRRYHNNNNNNYHNNNNNKRVIITFLCLLNCALRSCFFSSTL